MYRSSVMQKHFTLYPCVFFLFCIKIENVALNLWLHKMMSSCDVMWRLPSFLLRLDQWEMSACVGASQWACWSDVIIHRGAKVSLLTTTTFYFLVCLYVIKWNWWQSIWLWCPNAPFWVSFSKDCPGVTLVLRVFHFISIENKSSSVFFVVPSRLNQNFASSEPTVNGPAWKPGDGQ